MPPLFLVGKKIVGTLIVIGIMIRGKESGTGRVTANVPMAVGKIVEVNVREQSINVGVGVVQYPNA